MLFVTAIVMFIAVLLLGGLFFWVHSLPERMAHKSQKLQMEIVALLCLIALFTHMHIFWIAALLLAFIDFPGVMSPFTRIAVALERAAPPAAAGAASPDRPTPPDLSAPPAAPPDTVRHAPPDSPAETAAAPAERRDGEA